MEKKELHIKAEVDGSGNKTKKPTKKTKQNKTPTVCSQIPQELLISVFQLKSLGFWSLK